MQNSDGRFVGWLRDAEGMVIQFTAVISRKRVRLTGKLVGVSLGGHHVKVDLPDVFGGVVSFDLADLERVRVLGSPS